MPQIKEHIRYQSRTVIAKDKRQPYLLVDGALRPAILLTRGSNRNYRMADGRIWSSTYHFDPFLIQGVLDPMNDASVGLTTGRFVDVDNVRYIEVLNGVLGNAPDKELLQLWLSEADYTIEDKTGLWYSRFGIDIRAVIVSPPELMWLKRSDIFRFGDSDYGYDDETTGNFVEYEDDTVDDSNGKKRETLTKIIIPLALIISKFI